MNRNAGSDDVQSTATARLGEDAGETQDTLELVEIALTQYTRRQTAENAQFTANYKKALDEADKYARMLSEDANTSWDASMAQIRARDYSVDTAGQDAEKLFALATKSLEESLAKLAAVAQPEKIDADTTHDDVGPIVQSVYQARAHAHNKVRRRAVKQHHRLYSVKQQEAESLVDAKRVRAACKALLQP